MVCKACGHDNPKIANYCMECGNELNYANSPSNQKKPYPKTATVRIGILVGLIIIAFVVIFSFNIFGGSDQSKIKGTWLRNNSGLDTTETITYTFTSKGGTNSYSSEGQNYISEEAEFQWYITSDRDLVILWSSTNCTKYTWNPDFSNYSLSTNPYSWCIKGDTMYLSSTAAYTGYYVYDRQGS